MRKVVVVALFVACTPKADLIKNAAPEAKPTAEVSTVTNATAKEEGECHHDAKAGEDCEHDAKTEKAAAPTDAIHRGAAFKGEKTVALKDLLAKPEAFDKQIVTTEGIVRQVCQKKGCWMELAADAKGPGARITFKDYEFFVPKDSAQKHAKIEGSVKLAELSEERAKHYESEGATVPRGKDGKAREVQLVATAVEIAAK
ncbi:MAG: DUF4920 domain-containing protein [Deltaproteobacteria bacterium]|nr:DUF4920 domain-containing protein [Deltaproteobacteria bacterium]